MSTLDSIVAGRTRVWVRQQKHWGEILLPYETRNRYELLGEGGEILGQAFEEARGARQFIGRQLLGAMRPASVHVVDAAGQEIAKIEKFFRLYFHEAELREGGRALGRVRRRFSVLRYRFTVEDEHGRPVLEIERGFLDRFRFRGRFRARVGEREVALIAKHWRGLLGELFSDADTFGIAYEDPMLGPAERRLLFAAVFLIDFACFENNQGSKGGLASWLPGLGE